jgi:hypothetical protein
MDPLFQFRFGTGELLRGSDAGVLACSVYYVSLATDTATITTHQDVDLAYGSTAAIHYAGRRVFLGVVQSPLLVRSGADWVKSYSLQGPWWHLTRIPYRQSWMLLQDAAIGPQPSSRVILNQSPDGTPCAIAAQVADAVQCAIARGAPLQLGICAISGTLPYDEQRDLMCAQAIDRDLRFCPDISSWIDYNASPPMLYFGQGEPFATPDAIESDDISIRHDLVCPGITIEIERLGTLNNTQHRTIEKQTAGDVDALESAFCTMQLAGETSNLTTVMVDVETETPPDPLTDASWWIEHHPRLKNIVAADISFIDARRFEDDGTTLVTGDDLTTYPRMSLTPLPDLQKISVLSRCEIWRATVDIVLRDAAGAVIDQEHATVLDLPVVVTNAVTKKYHAVDDFDYEEAEPVPVDLASQLLAHWSRLYEQGTAMWPMASGIPTPGQTYGDYATPIQSLKFDSDQQSISAIFGPPRHLEPATLATRLQGFRNRRSAHSHLDRSTGESHGQQRNANQTIAKPVCGHAPGEKRQTTLKSSDGNASIVLDPGAVDSGSQISVRSWTFTGGGGEATVQVLGTKDTIVDFDAKTISTGDPNDPNNGRCPSCPSRWIDGGVIPDTFDNSVAAWAYPGGVYDNIHPGYVGGGDNGVYAGDTPYPYLCPPCRLGII